MPYNECRPTFRERKRQLGQFLTPRATAAAIVDRLGISEKDVVLEPSFGEGAFIFEIIAALARKLTSNQLRQWLQANLYACEIDSRACTAFASAWERAGYSAVPSNIEQCDFFAGCLMVATGALLLTVSVTSRHGLGFSMSSLAIHLSAVALIHPSRTNSTVY